jgi:hypothetical protein
MIVSKDSEAILKSVAVSMMVKQVNRSHMIMEKHNIKAL